MNYLQLDKIIKSKGITGKSLASQVDISTTAMSAIITGKSQPRFELLHKIANVLEVDIRELLTPTKTDQNGKQIINDIRDNLDRLDGLLN